MSTTQKPRKRRRVKKAIMEYSTNKVRNIVCSRLKVTVLFIGRFQKIREIITNN
jgi:hypothetical protein